MSVEASEMLDEPTEDGQIDREELVEKVERIGRVRDSILDEIEKRVFGQEALIEQMLIALFSRGHSLLMGVPGLAKTTLVSTLSQVLDLSFNRIQFTPDLMPADIIGTEILEENPKTGGREFKFVHGPVFSNLLLADEINRTPPKTQAALLQAMQEYEVSAGGTTYHLDLPFVVFATQNPIEQEGTYPLPEAQLDRFMFHLKVDYPSVETEELIAQRTTSDYTAEVESILDGPGIRQIQQLVTRVPVSEDVVQYAVELVRQTRPNAEDSPEISDRYIEWGAGPRASQYLILGGKAKALLDGRLAVSEQDIRDLTAPVLRHRVLLNFEAEAQGISTEELIEQIVDGG